MEPPDRHPLGERLRRAFFGSFFRLLLLVIATAEWACVAWILHLGRVHPPLLVHLAMPPLILLANRWIVVRRSTGTFPPRAQPALRAYAAFAFTSIFCGLFLAAAAVPWSVAEAAAVPLGRPYLWLVNTGFMLIAGLMIHGYTLGQQALAVSQLTVAIPGLPAAFEGFRIVHVTDLHIGQYLDLHELAEHVERVNALEPDLICLTGDLVDRQATCAHAFPTLGRLRARHGVLATLGNHDFYAGADAVTAALERLTPFIVLRDACTEVRVDGAVLPIVGVDDLGHDWARGVPEHPALPPLVADLGAGTPWILLSHRPDCFRQAARLGVSLMLSGHTHGGQLGLPGAFGARIRNLAEFITDFDRGEYRHGDATLYVNRGLGFTGQRIRLFTPREVACLELRAAPARVSGGFHGKEA